MKILYVEEWNGKHEQIYALHSLLLTMNFNQSSLRSYNNILSDELHAPHLIDYDISAAQIAPQNQSNSRPGWIGQNPVSHCSFY